MSLGIATNEILQRGGETLTVTDKGVGRMLSSMGFRSTYRPVVDTRNPQPNNACMSKLEAVRRIKSYSAASGFVYQYQFQEVSPVHRGLASGNEYVYYVSADRKTMFPLRILVRRDAVDQWARQTGRALTGTEEYAVAKMCLFQAFDEVEDLAVSRPELVVDDSNLAPLLERLDL